MPKVLLNRQQIINGVLRKPSEGEIDVSPEWEAKLRERGAIATSQATPQAAPPAKPSPVNPNPAPTSPSAS